MRRRKGPRDLLRGVEILFLGAEQRHDGAQAGIELLEGGRGECEAHRVRCMAVREASEELGIRIAPADLDPLTAMHRTAPTGLAVDQRVDFFFACRQWTGEPRLLEPKADDVRWFDLDGLPDNVVHHERFVLDGWRDGTLPTISAFGF